MTDTFLFPRDTNKTAEPVITIHAPYSEHLTPEQSRLILRIVEELKAKMKPTPKRKP